MGKNLVSVVTCDIVAQENIHGAAKESGSRFKQGRSHGRPELPDVVHTPVSFRVTQGDEFQFVLARPKSPTRWLFLSSPGGPVRRDPCCELRASVGLGEIAVEIEKTPTPRTAGLFINPD